MKPPDSLACYSIREGVSVSEYMILEKSANEPDKSSEPFAVQLAYDGNERSGALP
jgi:hypothetical protein